MLYAIITLLLAVLIAVSVKWAQAAREIRQLKVWSASAISHDAALYQIDRRFQAGIEEGKAEGLKQGLLAAEKAATDALVKGRPPVMAIRDLRNATK
jgi:flagellar biosynthesis/type III secretory pathway protein FliH